MVRTESTSTLKMRSTAVLISGFVAPRSTRKVRSWRPSCDSSFATSAFSVMTGALMMSQTVLILGRLLRLGVVVARLGLRPLAGRAALAIRVERPRDLLGSSAREHELLVIEHVVDVEARSADHLRPL